MTASSSFIVTLPLLHDMTALILSKESSESLLRLTLSFTVSPALTLLLLLPLSSFMSKPIRLKLPFLILVTALNASMRPEPCILLLVSVSFLAVVSNVIHISAGVSSLFFSSSRAMTPATQGVAIDVPLFKLYPLSVSPSNDFIPTPGAQTSGRMRPILSPP